MMWCNLFWILKIIFISLSTAQWNATFLLTKSFPSHPVMWQRPLSFWGPQKRQPLPVEFEIYRGAGRQHTQKLHKQYIFLSHLTNRLVNLTFQSIPYISQNSKTLLPTSQMATKTTSTKLSFLSRLCRWAFELVVPFDSCPGKALKLPNR